MKIDERKKIKAEAKSKVAEVLAQEDQAKMQAKLDELFNDVLAELAEVKAEKETTVGDNTKLTDDLESLKAEREELAGQKTDLEKKATELQQKLDEAQKRIDDLEGQMESMKQEAALQARVTELEEAGLLSAGTLAEKQKARIKAMDDEEFAEHKAYLAELRSGIAQKLEAEAKSKSTKTEDSSKQSDCKTKCAKSNKPDCVEDCLDNNSDEDTEGGSKSAAAALAELAELDLDETKITATQLLKYKKAAAALNVVSTKTIAIPDDFGDEELVGVDKATLKEYASLWEDEGGR